MNHDNKIGDHKLTVLLKQNMAGDRKGIMVSFAQMKTMDKTRQIRTLLKLKLIFNRTK